MASTGRKPIMGVWAEPELKGPSPPEAPRNSSTGVIYCHVLDIDDDDDDRDPAK